jgi:pimeloyl-ACP methyl ester carboxylesterase
MRSFAALLFFLLLVTPGEPAAARQQRPAYLDQAADVILPAGHDPARTYPVVIYLPFTGSSAAELRKDLAPQVPVADHLALVPRGVTEAEHYLPDFVSFAKGYEARLLADLSALQKRHRTGKVYLLGYSLGGDLAWALSVRNPERFDGVVLIGTRCSWPAPKASLARLKARGFRAAFMGGTREASDRLKGLRAASALVTRAGVASRYLIFEGAHTLPDAAAQKSALAFVFGIAPARTVPSTVRARPADRVAAGRSLGRADVTCEVADGATVCAAQALGSAAVDVSDPDPPVTPGTARTLVLALVLSRCGARAARRSA